MTKQKHMSAQDVAEAIKQSFVKIDISDDVEQLKNDVQEIKEAYDSIQLEFGVVGITPVKNGRVEQRVTFKKPFTSAPSVQLTLGLGYVDAAYAAAMGLHVGINTVTEDGFNIRLWGDANAYTSSPATVYWQAILKP